MPGKNTSFSIGEHFMGFIDTQVKEGRYSNASDVIRAALRLLEEREAKLTSLRAALIQGEESGPSTPFDFEAFIARKRDATPKPVWRATLSFHRALKPTLTIFGDYTADRWGLDQAETYTRDIWQRIEEVAARPAIGQECSDIRAGYYKISCGSHLLF
jgi:antitoxin ParD1/3/4